MTAYNRVLQRAVDGKPLDANDLNALIDDLKTWVLRLAPNGIMVPAPGGSTPHSDSSLKTTDSTTLTADAA